MEVTGFCTATLQITPGAMAGKPLSIIQSDSYHHVGFSPYALAFPGLVDKYLKCPKGENTTDNASEKLTSAAERQILERMADPLVWVHHPYTPVEITNIIHPNYLYI